MKNTIYKDKRIIPLSIIDVCNRDCVPATYSFRKDYESVRGKVYEYRCNHCYEPRFVSGKRLEAIVKHLRKLEDATFRDNQRT